MIAMASLDGPQIHRAKKVDEPSFAAALAALIPDLHARALTLTHNTANAEDLVQETLERAWSIRHRSRSALRPWCFAIMRNLNGNHIQEGRRVFAQVPLDEVPAVECSTDSAGNLLRLRKATRRTTEIPE